MLKILNSGASPRGWHRLQLASECLQKYAWTYKPGEPAQPADPTILGESPEVQAAAPALARGRLIHLGLAQHYARMKNRQEGKSENEWMPMEEAVHQVAAEEKCTEHVKDVLETLAAYKRAYVNDEFQIKILEVEGLNETKLGGQYRLTGRFDLVYESAGQIYVCDHKTSGRITNQHKLFYSVSGQLLGYSRMAREKYGERFGGMVVNLVQLPPKPTFMRIPLPRSPNLEMQFEDRAVDIEQSIERLLAERRKYTDWPKAMSELTCMTRYGACPFFDRCRFGEGAQSAGDFILDL